MSENIKAMIMAAGVGSRLEPLTKNVPKPLVPVAGKPVMDILFENLASIGVKDVICNTYYLADKIIERYSHNNFEVNFNYIREESLSGTAGGVKKCQFFFDKNMPFLVLSADGLSDADLKKGLEIHKKSGAVATIGIKPIPLDEVSHFGVVVTNNSGYVTEFQEKPEIKDAKSNFINTGIYIFDYKIFDYIPDNTFYDFAKNVFPKLLQEHALNTFDVGGYWSDIGTIDQYIQSNFDVFEDKCLFKHVPVINKSCGAYISADSVNFNTVEFIGYSVLGHNSKIGQNVIIENSIIWDNVTIEDNVRITNCVIGSNCTVKTDMHSQITGANEIITKKAIKI